MAANPIQLQPFSNFNHDLGTPCSGAAMVQNGGRCFLVASLLLFVKVPKLLAMISQEDRDFIRKVADVKSDDTCPIPPSGLQKRYQTVTGGGSHDITSDISGHSLGVIDALLSYIDDGNARAPHPLTGRPAPDGNGRWIMTHEDRTAGYQNLSSLMRLVRLTQRWSRIASWMKLHKQRFLHMAGVSMVTTLEFTFSDRWTEPADPSEEVDGRSTVPLGKGFAKQLQNICASNDRIVGGILSVERIEHTDGSNKPKPNADWKLPRLRQYIRERPNLKAKAKHKKATKKNELSAIIEEYDAANWDDSYSERQVETIRHDIAFTVCHSMQENKGKAWNDYKPSAPTDGRKRNPSKPEVVVCNWGACYRLGRGRPSRKRLQNLDTKALIQSARAGGLTAEYINGIRWAASGRGSNSGVWDESRDMNDAEKKALVDYLVQEGVSGQATDLPLTSLTRSGRFQVLSAYDQFATQLLKLVDSNGNPTRRADIPNEYNLYRMTLLLV